MENEISINIGKISAKVQLLPERERKHPNLLANASITLKEESSGGRATITGFTIWKSKYQADPSGDNNLNVMVPQKRNFKYLLFNDLLWFRIKKLIVDAYAYKNIPVIGESDSGIDTIEL